MLFRSADAIFWLAVVLALTWRAVPDGLAPSPPEAEPAASAPAGLPR